MPFVQLPRSAAESGLFMEVRFWPDDLLQRLLETSANTPWSDAADRAVAAMRELRQLGTQRAAGTPATDAFDWDRWNGARQTAAWQLERILCAALPPAERGWREP